ncbi:MAG: ATP-dependent DNA helicase, partial [Treponemataceae bacterium]|nr:ATP-dependent DNA helicase [Treponemataceae bacterium]
MCNKIDINQSVKYLSQNGPLAKINPDFEERKSQLELVKNITQCFNENQIGVFEAGTGVGKSYAYLIPALLWAKENNQRVVISTGTINLQQQLAEKDIIQAQKILETNEKFLLLKGRQNYVCLRRLKDLEEEKDLFFEEVEELKIISEWVKNSETGSKSELTFLPSEAVWQRINSESDACMGNRCKFFEDCFVMKVRKAANEAKILIVNHHLLFSDIQLRLSTQKYDEAAVLPPYTRLIFDEAHGIEAAATSFFSESLNKFSVQKQLNLLYRQRKSSATGLLFSVHALSDSTVEMNEIIGALDQIKVNIQLLEDAGLEVLKNDFAWRLWAGSCFYANKLLDKFVKLNESILEFSGLVRDVLKGLHEKDAELPSVWETKQVLNRVEAFGLVCKNFITWEERPDSVFWIEKRKLSTGAMYL